MEGNIASNYRSNTARRQLELSHAFSDWISNWIEEERELYLVSFMFKPIGGAEATQLRIMEASLVAFYATLVTRVVRRPRSASSDQLPRLIAHPDLPVPKRGKISLADATINGGLHFHGLIGLPPYSRLREGLEDHLAAYTDLYCPGDGRIARIHASPVIETPRKAVRYTLKMAGRGRFGVEHTVLLPRSLSELGSRQ